METPLRKQQVYNRYEIHEDGSFIGLRTGRKLKTPIRSGYKAACIFFNGKKKNVYIHRMLAVAFIPNPDNKPCVNHKDADKLNNALSNLEWVTMKENYHHAKKLNLIKPQTKGRLVYCQKTGKIFNSVAEAARQLKINPRTLSDMISPQVPTRNRTSLVFACTREQQYGHRHKK